jgi:hypothetical protein
MAVPLFFIFPTGGTYFVKVIRAVDLFIYDFGSSTFVASGGTQTTPLPEVSAGSYVLNLATPLPTWASPDYVAQALDGSGIAKDECAFTLTNGSFATPQSPTGGILVSGSTPSNIILSGLLAGSTFASAAGALAGTNQRLWRALTNEGRVIANQSIVSGNYSFTFGSGAVEAGPFSTSPALVVGETFYVMP